MWVEEEEAEEEEEDDDGSERSCGQFKILSLSFLSSQAGFRLLPLIVEYCKREKTGFLSWFTTNLPYNLK